MNNDKFVEWLKKYGDIRPLDEAFKNFPVEEEEHKGKYDAYVKEEDEKYNVSYKIGDIVYVKKFKYPNGKIGENHLFVIIGKNNIAVPIEKYFGMLISSKIQKVKYKSNKLLIKDNKNNLNVNSIVKTDVVYQIDRHEISYKVGKVSRLKVEEYKNYYKKIKKYKDKKTEEKMNENEELQRLTKLREEMGLDKISIRQGSLAEGEEKAKIEIAKKMKQKNILIDEIAEITGLSKEKINKI